MKKPLGLHPGRAYRVQGPGGRLRFTGRGEVAWAGPNLTTLLGKDNTNGKGRNGQQANAQRANGASSMRCR